MHSWRTLITPYNEQNDIYQAYNFDEPWNGPNNKKLTSARLGLLHCPSDETENWDEPITNYIAVTGPGTIWPGDKSTKIEDITDGTENTILLVEIADSDIHWAEPRDITLAEALGKSDDAPTNVPTSNHRTEGTYFCKDMPIAGHVLMADGSNRTLYKRPSSKDMAALLSIAGGEKIDESIFDADYDYPLWQTLRWDHVLGLPLFIVAVIWFWVSLVKDGTRVKLGTDAKAGIERERPDDNFSTPEGE